MTDLDTPPLGSTVQDIGRSFTAKVSSVFMGSGVPGMILEWTDRDTSKKRGQAFTCRDWRKRWKVIRKGKHNGKTH